MKTIISLILAILIAVQPSLIALAHTQYTITRTATVLTPQEEDAITDYLLEAVLAAYPIDVDVVLSNTQVANQTWTFYLQVIEEDVTTNETLTGTADYRLSTTSQESYEIQLNANLTSAQTSLAIDVTILADLSAGYLQQMEAFTLRLDRNGTPTETTIQKAITLSHPTFESSLIETRYTLTQGDISMNNTTRIAVRQIDHQNSEVWAKVENDDGLRFSAHLWEHFTGDSYTQFFDTLSIQLDDINIQLATPGSIRITSAGIEDNLTFIDSDGTVFSATDMTIAQSNSGITKGASPALMQFAPLFSPCSGGLGGALGGIGGAALGEAVDGAYDIAGFLDNAAGAGLTPAQAGARDAARNVAARRAGNIFSQSNIVGFIFSFMVGIIADRAKERIRNDPTLSPSERAAAERRVDMLAWGANVAFGLALALSTGGLGLGFFAGAVLSMPGGPLDSLGNALGNALCNADPYFIQPDERRFNASSNDAIQVTFVSNGQHIMPQAPPIPPPQSADTLYEYRDNPQNIIAGMIPPNATAIGAWEWSDDITFNGIPAHTNGHTTGSNVHYYIDAEPFIIGANDNLVQYVYIDPQNPPSQLYLQVYIGDGDGEYRAYWGANIAQTGGIAGTNSLLPIGDISRIETGTWVRLTISAEALQIADQPITGILYGAVDGRVWWGLTTTADRLTDNAPATLAVNPGTTLLPTESGAQVGFILHQAGDLTATVHAMDGQKVRTLYEKRPVEAGFHAIDWDANDDNGNTTPDGRYYLQLALNDDTPVNVEIRTTSLVAQLLTPNAYSVIRGDTVPIIGLAHGEDFAEYVVEYGEGLNPTQWTRITRSTSPAPLPRIATRPGFAHSNLGIWDVGLDEFGGRRDSGLNGVYTLRLRVIAQDGGEAVDSIPIIVGRLAHSVYGNTINSPDGNARIIIPPLSIRESYVLLGIVPAELTDPNGDLSGYLPQNVLPAGQVYEILPPNDTFLRPITLEIPFDAGAELPQLLIGDGEQWQVVPAVIDGNHLRAQVSDFGSGKRALVGAFRGDFSTFAMMTLPATPEAGATIRRDNLALYDDFNTHIGGWQALDINGTRLSLVERDTGDNALRIAQNDGVRLTQVTATPFDTLHYPIVTFDYRLQPGDSFNLLAQMDDGKWLQVNMGGGVATGRDIKTVKASPLIDDGEWHRAQIDLYRLLQDTYPNRDDYVVNQLVLGRLRSIAYEQIVPIDNTLASAYDIDNFAILRPVNNPNLSDGLQTILDGDVAYPVLVDNTAPIFDTPSPSVAGTPYQIVVRFDEHVGIDPTSILFSLNDTPYTLSGRGASLSAEALFIYPQFLDPPLSDILTGDTIHVRVDALTDYAGNIISAPLAWSFVADIPRVSGDDLRQVTENGAEAPALSPDGGRLAYVQAGDILVINIDDADAPSIFIGTGIDPAWSPDGEQIAFISSDDALVVASADGNGQPRTLHTGGKMKSPTWSPDGQALAVVLDGNISHINATTGAVTPLTDHPERPYRSVDWQPNGSLLALGFDLYERRIELLDLNTGEITPLTEGIDAIEPTWLNNTTVLFTSGTQIWQISSDGSDATVFESSEGTSNAKATVARSGGALAFISTRGGQRDVWVKRTLQLANVTISPTVAQPNEPITISYGLPSDAEVSIVIIGTDDTPITTLRASQSVGVQSQTWDTTGIETGVYQVAISAQIGTTHIERIAEAKIQAPSAPPDVVEQPISPPIEDGTGHLVTQLYSADGVTSYISSRIRVYAPGDRQSPLSITAGTNPLRLDLPAGVYDVVMVNVDNIGEQEQVFEDVIITAGETTRLEHVFAIGRLEAQFYSADGVTSYLSSRLRVYAPGDRQTPLVNTGAINPLRLDLPAGVYDVVMVNVDNIGEQEQVFEDVVITAGETTHLEHIFAVGQLEAQFYSADGVTSYISSRIRIYAPGDRETPLASTGFSNVIRQNLPAGVYDVVMINVDDSGEQEQVFEDVIITAGETTRLESRFAIGRLEAQFYSADGVIEFLSTRIRIYAPGDRQTPLASTGFSNPIRQNLPIGVYDVVMVNVDDSGEQEQVFEDVVITAGETTHLEHVFAVGRLEAQFYSADDVTEFLSTRIRIYAPGDRQTPLASTGFSNPIRQNLPAGVYDVVMVNVDDTGEQEQVFENVVITAGERMLLEHIFAVGRLEAQFYSGDDVTNFISARIRIYAPGDRQAPLASTGFNNPLRQNLPAGVYDVVMVNVDDSGEQEQVFENVVITAGERMLLEHIFDIGQVQIDLPSSRFSVSVYVPSDLTTRVARLSFANPIRIALPAGVYTLILADSDTQTEVHRFEAVQINSGQVTDLTYTP